MAASSALKFMTLFCEVRPIHWARASFFPSTITSNTLPKLDAFLRIDITLLFLQGRQPPRLLGVRNWIFELQCGRIGPRRILEAEDAVVLDFIEQRKGFLELCLRLAGEADDDV